MDRSKLQRTIGDLRLGEGVIAEKIDRISRLPLPEAEKFIEAIRVKGTKLAISSLIDVSELAAGASGVAKIVLESIQKLLLRLALQMAREDYKDQIRFTSDFASELLRINRSALHLYADEADTFAPQMVEIKAKKFCLGTLSRLVKQGEILGVGPR